MIKPVPPMARDCGSLVVLLTMYGQTAIKASVTEPSQLRRLTTPLT